jgi:aryl-alcohol dehydrogenase-like predicted oxidoreductase
VTAARVQLGRSDLRVSRVALGTVFRSEPDDDTCLATIAAGLDAGCNFIDTANAYLDGHAEELVGRAINGRRNEVVIATKVGSQRGGLSRQAITDEAEASLRRLQTDYIDLYIFHHPDPATPIEESLGAVDELIRQGKVRYLGFSNFHASQLRAALHAAASEGLPTPVSDQVVYSLADRGIESDLVPLCAAHGLSVTPFCVTLIGLLTGRLRHGQPPPPDSPWARGPYNYHAAMTPRLDRVVQTLIDIGRRHGRSPVQVAIAWCLSRPCVAATIVGAETPEQARQNALTAAWTLPDYEAAELEQAASGLRVQIRKDCPNGYVEARPGIPGAGAREVAS